MGIRLAMNVIVLCIVLEVIEVQLVIGLAEVVSDMEVRSSSNDVVLGNVNMEWKCGYGVTSMARVTV